MTCQIELPWLPSFSMLLLALMLAAPHGIPSLAQEADGGVTVESLVDRKIRQGAPDSNEIATNLMSAIESSASTSRDLFKVFHVEEIVVVYVSPDTLTDEIAERMELHREGIEATRTAIDTNALLYAAVESQPFSVEDILAVNLIESDHLQIFVAGDSPE